MPNNPEWGDSQKAAPSPFTLNPISFTQQKKDNIIMSQQRSNVFSQQAPPIHVGRKFYDQPAANRSRSADSYGLGLGKRKIDGPDTSHLVVKPTLPRQQVEGAVGTGNQSHCPWNPEALEAPEGRHSKRPTPSPHHEEHRLGKAQFPSQASYLSSRSKPKEERAHQRRTADAARVFGQSKEQEWRPVKRIMADRRSASAETSPASRPLSRSPSASSRHTPLWGPASDPVPTRGSGVRMSRSPSSDGLSQPRTPYATSFDLNMAPAQSRTRSPAPYDDTYRATGDDVGRVYVLFGMLFLKEWEVLCVL